MNAGECGLTCVGACARCVGRASMAQPAGCAHGATPVMVTGGCFVGGAGGGMPPARVPSPGPQQVMAPVRGGGGSAAVLCGAGSEALSRAAVSVDTSSSDAPRTREALYSRSRTTPVELLMHTNRGLAVLALNRTEKALCGVCCGMGAPERRHPLQLLRARHLGRPTGRPTGEHIFGHHRLQFLRRVGECRHRRDADLVYPKSPGANYNIGGNEGPLMRSSFLLFFACLLWLSSCAWQPCLR